MRRRFGALLCLALGAVLIGTGLSGGSAASVGALPPACSPSADAGVLNPGTCPTGTIQVTEVTDRSADASAPDVASWTLSVISVGTVVCTLPDSGTTRTVPTGGTVSFTNLLIFQSTDVNDATTCQYRITETPVAGYTTAFDPSAPYSFSYTSEEVRARPHAFTGSSPIAVTVTNTALAATTSSTPTSTAPSSSVPASSSAGTSASASSDPASATASPSSSAAPVLAATGPSRPVRGSLIAGIALCLLGLVLLFAGRRPAVAGFGRHRS